MIRATRALRQQRVRVMVQTPSGGQLYVKHLPRRVKRAVKKGAMQRRLTLVESRAATRYLQREGQRDQSHRFTMPKAKWGPGAWQAEPDFVAFVHAGLHCVIQRNLHVTGSLNGYVGVDDTHPWWGKGYDECVATPQCEPAPPPDFEAWAEGGMPVPHAGSYMRAMMRETRWSCDHTVGTLVDIHGGVTCASASVQLTKRPHRALWWFGFDTCHAGDHSPMMEATLKEVYSHTDPTGREWAEHQRVLIDSGYETYKDLVYVRHEVERLAEQLAMAAQVQS